jgi:hypothetical protein
MSVRDPWDSDPDRAVRLAPPSVPPPGPGPLSEAERRQVAMSAAASRDNRFLAAIARLLSH